MICSYEHGNEHSDFARSKGISFPAKRLLSSQVFYSTILVI